MSISPQKFFDEKILEILSDQVSEFASSLPMVDHFKMNIKSESMGIFRVTLIGRLLGIDVCSHGLEKNILRAFALAKERFHRQVIKIEKIKSTRRPNFRLPEMASLELQGGLDVSLKH